jgi:hypothetical protein
MSVILHSQLHACALFWNLCVSAPLREPGIALAWSRKDAERGRRFLKTPPDGRFGLSQAGYLEVIQIIRRMIAVDTAIPAAIGQIESRRSSEENPKNESVPSQKGLRYFV